MSVNSGLTGNLWESFINYMFGSGDLNVPSDFHDRCEKINTMLDDDVTGIVSTITNYSVNSASSAFLKVECSDNILEKILNMWLSKININVNGIPTGLHELSKEYYKERWQGSSLCLMRISNWEKISSGNTTIEVPTVLWFVNGASVYIKRKNKKNYKLGTDEYYLDLDKKYQIPQKGEEILVTKPFSRWFDEYPSPYLIKQGVLKNWLALEALASKGDEVISKVLPYLLIMKKGTEGELLQGKIKFDDPDLQQMSDNFKKVLERYKQEKDKTPVAGFPFDQSLEHVIPDLTKILSEELFKQGLRALLAGLGFVSVVQGVGDTRKEEVNNPKPFIAEINTGVSDFKSMLMDVIRLIIEKNKIDHRKLFSDTKVLQIINSPLKINFESVLDSIRSGFVYGAVSYETFQEVLGLNPIQEYERTKKEWEKDFRKIYYPHNIQNVEDKGIDTDLPITKKQEEKNNEKTKQPEHMKTAYDNLFVKSTIAECSECGHQFEYLSVQEAGMGYVKCPKCSNAVTQEDLIIAPYDKNNPPDFLKKYPKGAIDTFIDVFNENLPKGEDYAFPVAWTALKRWMKKHGYKKVNKKWVKEEKKS